MPIIIIESPNKREKIAKITGYKVYATIGHFMDLVDIDIKNNYKPTHEYNEGKKSKIYKAIEDCKGEVVYIASDPDREGYAIGYFFYEKIKNVAKEIYRTEFHEITESGIKKGLKESVLFSATNQNYFQAFLGRQCGDRMIGFALSTILSRTLNMKGLSAGRVQTPALSIIFNKDEEIQNYDKLPMDEKLEYQIQAKGLFDENEMILKHIDNGKEKKYANKEEALKDFEFIKNESLAIIKNIEKKDTISSPPKPFTTSKLLKVASKKLGIATDEIQTLAQNLFEAGLITYIRTDSESLSKEFLDKAEKFYSPIYKDVYKYTEYSAGKNSQAEAHEAIRITHPHKYEDLNSIVKQELKNCSDKHIKLYDLIFKNTLQSQCKNAVFENTIVTLNIRLEEFKVSFRVMKSKGWMGIFDDIEDNEESEDGGIVSKFNSKENDQISLKEVFIKDIMKNKPRPYLEADFIEVLEKHGIGRPSTYATYLPTLEKRNYIEIKDKKRVISITKLGKEVINHFKKDNTWILDLKYTAELESELDSITNGKKTYLDCMKEIHQNMNNTEIGLIKVVRDPNAPTKRTPPSDKQLDFAKMIASKVGKNLPKDIENDWKICSDFIKKNLDSYNATKGNNGNSKGGK